MWSIWCVAHIDIKAQASLTPSSIFLFLDVPTLRIIIIINVLPTDSPEITLPTAHTTKT